MMLQETHSPSNSQEIIFNDAGIASLLLASQMSAERREHHGVGFMLNPKLLKYIDQLYFDSSRVAAIRLNTYPLPLLLVT
eukprot:4184203-Amphidinium_carterae.1